MSETVIRRAARALNPDQPIKMLAGLRPSPRSTAKLRRTARSTAKSWATGRRRPPVVILKILRDVLKDRRHVADIELIRELEYVIGQREGEPKRLTGFNEIRERDGPGSVPRNGRNRRGRPRFHGDTPAR